MQRWDTAKEVETDVLQLGEMVLGVQDQLKRLNILED